MFIMFGHHCYWSTPVDFYHWSNNAPVRHMNIQSTTVQSSRQTCPTVQQAYSDDSGYILPQLALRVSV